MSEPDWEQIRERLMAMTTRQLRVIARDWFSGMLGGASTKATIVGEMVSQMRHWWHLPDGYGLGRVKNVMREIEGMGAGS